MRYVDEGGCYSELNDDGTITVGLSKLLGVTPHPGLNLHELVDVTLFKQFNFDEKVGAGDTLVELRFTKDAAKRAGVQHVAYYFGVYAPVDGEVVWIDQDFVFEELKDGPIGFLTKDIPVAQIKPNNLDEYRENIEIERDYLLSDDDIAAGKTMADF